MQQLTADNNRQEQRIRDFKIALDSKLAELEAGGTHLIEHCLSVVSIF
ncbi:MULTISPECIES: hypothetical protein [unclassified Microcoleus]